MKCQLTAGGNVSEMCCEREWMGIPIPTIPWDFGSGIVNLSWGIILTILGSSGMGMRFCGNSKIASFTVKSLEMKWTVC